MIGRWGRYAVTFIAAMAMGEAAAALVITGPTTAVPGQEITLNIELDAPLGTGAFDDLTLVLDFGAPLVGVDALPGSLLAGTAFTPNAAGGLALASFIATQADLGPGVLASWKFKVDSNAVVPSTAVITPHLQTLLIDDINPPPPVDGNPFTVHIVPEPSVNVLMIGGLLVICWWQRRTGIGVSSSLTS